MQIRQVSSKWAEVGPQDDDDAGSELLLGDVVGISFEENFLKIEFYAVRRREKFVMSELILQLLFPSNMFVHEHRRRSNSASVLAKKPQQFLQEAANTWLMIDRSVLFISVAFACFLRVYSLILLSSDLASLHIN